jgi:hypothetical protein
MNWNQFGPFFDQDSPDCEIDGLIASEDRSPSWELEAAAVFKAGRRYLVVYVSGCSCWPDRGSTNQVICHSRVDVDRELAANWKSLAAACQDAKWEVTQAVVSEPQG